MAVCQKGTMPFSAGDQTTKIQNTPNSKGLTPRSSTQSETEKIRNYTKTDRQTDGRTDGETEARRDGRFFTVVNLLVDNRRSSVILVRCRYCCAACRQGNGDVRPIIIASIKRLIINKRDQTGLGIISGMQNCHVHIKQLPIARSVKHREVLSLFLWQLQQKLQTHFN